MDGGHSGKPGRQQWVQVGGKTEELASVCGLEILPGERLILETPGGGGYGTPKQAD